MRALVSVGRYGSSLLLPSALLGFVLPPLATGDRQAGGQRKVGLDRTALAVARPSKMGLCPSSQPRSRRTAHLRRTCTLLCRNAQMSNIALLFVCLLIGMVLHRSGKLPANAPATINGVIIHVSLPALILQYVHRVDLRENLLAAAAMPWLLFGIGALVFWLASKALKLPRGTTGALMMLGGLGNTSFIGLPMIESFYGPAFLSVGILIDQLGTYLVLSTLGIAVACFYSEGSASWREIAWRVATFPPLLAMLLALALIPVSYPEWVEATLLRLGGTLAPLALLSVGLQLRLGTLLGNRSALAMGLGFKLVLGPALVTALYVAVFRGGGEALNVTLFEAAMAPQIGASIVAIQHGLNPPLVTLMVGIGTVASFVSLPIWWYVLGAI